MAAGRKDTAVTRYGDIAEDVVAIRRALGLLMAEVEQMRKELAVLTRAIRRQRAARKAAKAKRWAPRHDYVADWNAIAEELGLPPISRLTPSRTELLQAAEADDGFDWPQILQELRASSKRWRDGFKGLGFGWVVKQDNYTKILEGRYRDSRYDAVGRFFDG